MNFRSIPLSLLLLACAHGHEGSAHEAAPGRGTNSTAASSNASAQSSIAATASTASAVPSVATLDITLGPRALPEAPKPLVELDWEHALRLSEPKAAKSESERPRATTLAASVSIALRVPKATSLWMAVDGFTPRQVDSTKGTALSALVPELTGFPAGVHRVVCFATDGAGNPLARSDGSPLLSELTFEYAPAGAPPVGASAFHERRQTPIVVQPRGTFNSNDAARPVELLVWHPDPEQSLLLRVEDEHRAQAFLQLSRGSYLLAGIGNGDFHFSLAAAGAADSVEWTLSVNRDLSLPVPANSAASAASAPAPASPAASASGAKGR